jgi:putative intracellular protease/amidase
MLRKHRRLMAAFVLAVLGVVAAGGTFFLSLNLDTQPRADPATPPSAISIGASVAPSRGRVLVVATSTARSPRGEIAAGMELTELSRAYYTFLANGYAVDLASPAGGRPPVVIDDDLIDVDYAFLNDTVAQQALATTRRLREVDPANYDAVYYVGGKGVMFDFADNPDVQRIAAAVYESGGVIGAVCHGPAALVGVKLSDGRNLLQNRKVAGFTNEEELYLIPEAREVFPFLLEDRLRAEGAEFVSGPIFLDNTIVDGRLVTGQNPWSTWSVAEGMVRAMGHEPVSRPRSREEIAVDVLRIYHREGHEAASAILDSGVDADKRLLLMHAFIAATRGQWRDAFNIHGMAHID